MLLRDHEVGIILQNPNMLVPHFLMHSYLYYEQSESVISDSLFDTICRRLDAEWDKIEHMHKHLITREHLSSGSGFALFKKLPVRVRRAAVAMFLEFGGSPKTLSNPDDVNRIHTQNYEDFIGGSEPQQDHYEDFI